MARHDDPGGVGGAAGAKNGIGTVAGRDPDTAIGPKKQPPTPRHSQSARRAPCGRLSFETVRDAARGRWGDILPRLGIPAGALRNRHGPCPGCGGTDRWRWDDRDGRGTYYCGGGGDPSWGDGFAALQHVHGWDAATALRGVAETLGMGGGEPTPCRPAPPPRRDPPPPAPAKPATRQTLDPGWHRRWDNALTITAHSPAGRYLAGRGCALPHPDGDLRWHPRVRHWLTGHVGAALIGLITDARTADPVTLHFTWIAPNGPGKADVDPPRLTLPGHTNVGIMRLWPDAEVTHGLAIAEGVETALSFARSFASVWATTVAGNLSKMPALPGIECLTIIQDPDPAGRKAASQCAARWHAAGAEVRLVEPEAAHE